MARSDEFVSHGEPDPTGHASLVPPLRVKWAEKEEPLRRPVRRGLKGDVRKERPLVAARCHEGEIHGGSPAGSGLPLRSWRKPGGR